MGLFDTTPDGSLVEFKGPTDAVVAEKLQPLVRYMALIEGIAISNEHTAPALITKLLQGMQVASQVIAECIVIHNNAENGLRIAEKTAALEEFKEEVAVLGLKGTEVERGFYVKGHALVLHARNEVAKAEALLEQAKTCKMSLIMATSSLRASVYSFRDSNMVGL